MDQDPSDNQYNTLNIDNLVKNIDEIYDQNVDMNHYQTMSLMENVIRYTSKIVNPMNFFSVYDCVSKHN